MLDLGADRAIQTCDVALARREFCSTALRGRLCDRLQLMYGEAGFGTNYFSGGDLTGLHQVGAAGGCL